MVLLKVEVCDGIEMEAKELGALGDWECVGEGRSVEDSSSGMLKGRFGWKGCDGDIRGYRFGSLIAIPCPMIRSGGDGWIAVERKSR